MITSWAVRTSAALGRDTPLGIPVVPEVYSRVLSSQAVRRAGRVALPLPEGTLSTVAAVARNVGVGQIGLDQIDLFVHGRVVDTTKLVREFGFTPRTTAEAFDDFIRGHANGSSLTHDRLAAAEQAILDGIRRVRATAAEPAGGGERS